MGSEPGLAAWRGGDAKVKPLPQDAEARIRRSKPQKRNSIQAEEFLKANPELKELDRIHGYYERKFVRRRKRKRNPDGFDHRPTFTLPDPVQHPCWFVFNAPQTSPQGYGNLVVPGGVGEMGSIELRLLTGPKQGAAFPCDWVRLRFKSDPRLADFHPCKVADTFRKGKDKGRAKAKDAFEFIDRQIHTVRSAQISGVKLMFEDITLDSDGSLRSAVPHLLFSSNVKDEPLTDAAKNIKWIETGAPMESGKRRKTVTVPDGLIACAVDLGIRHLGFGTIAQYHKGTPQILRSRNIWIGHEEEGGAHPGRWSNGPDLAHLAQHKWDIRKLRQLRGHPVRGETSHAELQGHITRMGKDRFKKSARAIVNFALNAAKDLKSGLPYPRADVLLLEKLSGMIPDGEHERGINRALVAWNRGQLVTRIRQIALDAGLKVIEVYSFGTSQVCSRCGAMGRRYSIRSDSDSLQPVIHFGPVERLFACPCGYYANSDHNASINLHRRFSLGKAAVSAYAQFHSGTELERRAVLNKLETDLLPQLRQLHGPPKAAFAADELF